MENVQTIKTEEAKPELTLDAVEQQLKEMFEKLEGAESEVNRIENDKDDMNMTLDNLEGDKSDLDDEVDEINRSIERANNKAEQLAEDIAGIAEDKDELESSIVNLQDNIDDCRTEIDDYECDFADAKTDIESVKAQLEILLGVVEEMKKKEKADAKEENFKNNRNLAWNRFRRYLNNSGYQDTEGEGFDDEWAQNIKLVVENERAFIFIYQMDEPDKAEFTINRFIKTDEHLTEKGDFEGEPVADLPTLEEALAEIKYYL